MIEGVVCGDASHAARKDVVQQALIHGANRRTHGLSVDIVLEEQSELRAAAWRFLTDSAQPATLSEVLAEILRLDSAISIATLASLTGFHRAELERTQDWGAIVENLVDSWDRTSLGGGPAKP